MKIALITDTHFGARGDSVQFDNYFRKFYNDVFFPELQRRGIRTIIHLGDVFDRRKYINFQSLHRAKKYFFEPLAATKLPVDLVDIIILFDLKVEGDCLG